MTQVLEQALPETLAESDVVAAIQSVLAASPEPLTMPKIKVQLPVKFRGINLEEILQRQAAAQVLYQYPKYRSQQDRFWDRPMAMHLEALVQAVLGEGPLGGSELRRKLPAYAQSLLDESVERLIRENKLYRHPRYGRAGERLGLRPADPKDYLRGEFDELFGRMEQLGFSRMQIRERALEMLHDEEWESPRPPSRPRSPADIPETMYAEAAPIADSARMMAEPAMASARSLNEPSME